MACAASPMHSRLPVPTTQSVEPHIQQLHILPGLEYCGAFGDPGIAVVDAARCSETGVRLSSGSLPLGMIVAHCQYVPRSIRMYGRPAVTTGSIAFG
jgi:hypothetical protein